MILRWVIQILELNRVQRSRIFPMIGLALNVGQPSHSFNPLSNKQLRREESF